MRDRARIDRVIELLRMAWHRTPDQRLGQLVENVLHTPNSPIAPWLVDDDVVEKKLLAFQDGGFAAAERVS
jgi:uncharacterized protein YihD (DUF1040 family)